MGRPGFVNTTRRSYESHLRLYLIPVLGHLRLSELRHSHVDRLFVDLRKSREHRLSPASLRRTYATLNSALNDAVKRNMVAINHAAHVELPASVRPELNVWTM